MEELRSLEDVLVLQQVDTAIDRLLDERASLPELEKYRAAHDELEGLDSEIAETDSRLRELDLAADKAAGEIELDEQKLEVEERRLYAGGLAARDAEHLRNEVEMLRRRISNREDEALEMMEEREQVQTRKDALTTKRDRVAEQKARLEAEIKEAWSSIDTEVSRLETQKAEIVPRVDPALLELYEEIRPQKEGVAAVPFTDRVCGGCHLSHSAAEEVQVLKESPPRCIHCRRILIPQ